MSTLLIIAIILIVAGIICLLIELFASGFGFFGGLGLASLIVGFCLRIIDGAKWYEIAAWIIVLLAIVFGFIYFWSTLSKRYSNLVQNSTALPSDGKTEGTKDFSVLIGKTGITKTFLRPVGKAVIDNIIYDVISEDEIIESNENIKVVSVEGQKIMVKKV